MQVKHIIPRLVVFDTWTLNWDRCPPDGDTRRINYGNVFLTSEKASSLDKWCHFGRPEKYLNLSASLVGFGVGDIISLEPVLVVPGHPIGWVIG
jgi:hypothetical protein